VNEELGDLVAMGDNFVVPAPENNQEGVSFYVLQCQLPKGLVREDFSCVWGDESEAGDYVIQGTYYQKYGVWDNTYVYLSESRAAYVDAHLVRACKFPMTLASHRVKGDALVYKMSSDTLTMIEESLREWWARDA
jgi:hypothetical protein